MKRIALTLIIALLALPAVAMAKADLVVVTDAPPKSMNPHAYSSDANLSYMSNFFDGLLQRHCNFNHIQFVSSQFVKS